MFESVSTKIKDHLQNLEITRRFQDFKKIEFTLLFHHC